MIDAPPGSTGHLEGDRPRAGLAGLDPGGHARAARAHDRHIGLETPDIHYRQPRQFAPGVGSV